MKMVPGLLAFLEGQSDDWLLVISVHDDGCGRVHTVTMRNEPGGPRILQSSRFRVPDVVIDLGWKKVLLP
jgi:hypothetical protein